MVCVWLAKADQNNPFNLWMHRNQGKLQINKETISASQHDQVGRMLYFWNALSEVWSHAEDRASESDTGLYREVPGGMGGWHFVTMYTNPIDQIVSLFHGLLWYFIAITPSGCRDLLLFNHNSISEVLVLINKTWPTADSPLQSQIWWTWLKSGLRADQSDLPLQTKEKQNFTCSLFFCFVLVFFGVVLKWCHKMENKLN